MFGKTNTFNAWQDYIQTITNCKRRTKQERKRKMLSKQDMIQPNQPKIKETLVRRKSINSGKPNFSDNEGRFENAAVHFIKLATYSSFLDYTINVLYLLKQH